MALLKITHFWSNLLECGYQHNFPIWGYQHNFSIWGYQHNFPIWGYQHIFQILWSNLLEWGYQHNFPIWGYQHIFQILWSNLLAWGYQHNFLNLAWLLWLGKDKGSITKSAESGGTIHLEINFSSTVYSKSFLKGSPLSCTSLK